MGENACAIFESPDLLKERKGGSMIDDLEQIKKDIEEHPDFNWYLFPKILKRLRESEKEKP
jgi:hypothetical protein